MQGHMQELQGHCHGLCGCSRAGFKRAVQASWLEEMGGEGLRSFPRGQEGQGDLRAPPLSVARMTSCLNSD